MCPPAHQSMLSRFYFLSNYVDYQCIMIQALLCLSVMNMEYFNICFSLQSSSYYNLDLSVRLSIWVYEGHIIHHYTGKWRTCAPGRRNMHHSGAICTTVHKGDYVFTIIFGFTMNLKKLLGSHVFEWVTWLIYRFTSI